MTKYNQSIKQQVIEFYLQNGKNRSFTCWHFQLEATTLRRWIQQYNHSGINGLAVLGKSNLTHLNLSYHLYKRSKMGNFLQEMLAFILGLQIRALSANAYKPLINKV